VAVVAENYLAAVAAQGKMRVTWTRPPRERDHRVHHAGLLE